MIYGMTGTEDDISDLPQHVIELCRRHLGMIETVIPLATARHTLYRLSGPVGVGVLKIHADSPDLWLREHTANGLFHRHSLLLDAAPGYLLLRFVDAQPLVRRLTTDISSSPARLFEQAAIRLSQIHEASLEFDPDSIRDFPTDQALIVGLGSRDFLSSFTAATHLLPARMGQKRARRIYEAIARTIPGLEGIHRSACLIHGDFQPKNLLFDANESLAAVIDWELARIAPPLCDFATLLRFAPDDESESLILRASERAGISIDSRDARCHDLIRVCLGLSKPDLTGDDVPLWQHYVDGCAESLLENDPEPARAGARALLTLP